MSLNQVNSSGELERVAGLVNSEKINEMYEAFPSDASASNKLVAQYTPRSEYSINNSSSNDTWYKVGRYTGGNRSSRLDLISDRVDGQTFESSIRISGAGTNANYVSWIGEDGCKNSVNAVQIDSSYNLYIKLMSYSAVRIIAYGNFESFDYEALQSSPSGSNIPLQKLVTESDIFKIGDRRDIIGWADLSNADSIDGSSNYANNIGRIEGHNAIIQVRNPTIGYQWPVTNSGDNNEFIDFGSSMQFFIDRVNNSLYVRYSDSTDMSSWGKLVTESDLPKTKIYSYTDAVTSGVEIILDPSSSHDWWNLLASGNILSISLVTCDTTNATDVGAWVGTSTANHSLILRPATTASNSYYRVLVTYTGVSL